MLDFQADAVAADLRLPLIELELGFGKPLHPAPDALVARYRHELSDYVAQHTRPVAPDGRAWSVEVQDDMAVDLDQQPLDLVVHARMRPPPGAPLRRFDLNYDVITHEVASHYAMVSVRSDFANGVFASHPQLLGIIHYLDKSVLIDRSTGSMWRGFGGVFALGMEHIAEGTDHLLFLFTLLLPAPLFAARRRWAGYAGARHGLVALVKIVSAFTIGHSLTLFLGAMGWVHLPSRLIETVIALSIFVSAIHALRPLFPGREAFVAAGFGLVHGLAFASTLSELGLSGTTLATALLGFNLGIETMQLLVVAAALPWLLLIARTPAYRFVRSAGAIVAGIAALAWIGQRAFDWPNPFDAWIATTASHPLWLLCALATLALGSWGWQRLGERAVQRYA
ncbi:MAG: HupE/UreJ family protein [Rudaea sp.]|uniref:HupE/UreJ family protein n=1 Tax=Rudaea sp. TaxID=2136325 RepID=UPI0039E5641E